MITLISLLLNRRQKTSWESKKRKKIVLIEITSVHWNCILIMKRDYRTDTSDYGATEWASKQLLYPSGNFHWIITDGTNSFYWVADVRVDRGRFGIGGFETLFWLQLVSEWKLFSSATVNQKSSFQKPFWLSQLKLAGPPNSQRGTFLNRIYNSYRRFAHGKWLRIWLSIRFSVQAYSVQGTTVLWQWWLWYVSGIKFQKLLSTFRLETMWVTIFTETVHYIKLSLWHFIPWNYFVVITRLQLHSPQRFCTV